MFQDNEIYHRHLDGEGQTLFGSCEKRRELLIESRSKMSELGSVCDFNKQECMRKILKQQLVSKSS